MTSSEVGTFGVGPSEFDTSWWSNDESANAERACYFDDEYTFAPDGSFKIEQQDYTWREAGRPQIAPMDVVCQSHPMMD